MEKLSTLDDHELYKQIKIFPPGCQIFYNLTLSSNEVYFCYCSTMTVNIYYLKNFELKCIFNPKIEKYVKCACLNQGKSNELAVFYEEEVMIFNIKEEKIKETFKVPNFLKFMEFNNDNKLLLITRSEEVFIYDLNKKKLEQLKRAEKVLLAKWYPFNNSELVYATKENKLFLRNIDQKKSTSSIELEVDPKTLISEMSWYYIDENYKYLLVGTNNGRAFLIDWSQNVILMKFEKFGSGNRFNLYHTTKFIAITNLIWLKYEPGTFLSVTEKSNRVAFWNVSKKNYNEIAKFSDSSILYCKTLPHQSRVLLTLDNGSVVVYDVEKRKNIFYLEPNHTETIFDLKYSPLIYGLFATCSNDETIKVWDVNHNKIIYNINIAFLTKNFEKKSNPNQRLNIYSLCWSPNDKDLLISGDASSSIRLWDITKQKMIACCKLNPNVTECLITGIDWDGTTNNILATCLNSVYLLSFDNSKLQIVKEYKINTAVFQIKYNPFNKKEFAVACFDSTIKFFNVDSDLPVKSMTGHVMKVFGIFFNKYKKGLMASTSDDYTVGVWDLENTKSTFLKGHKHNTRHVVWLADMPNILVSGSWDGLIRVWNVDSAVCIVEITEHYSDVYGIDVSPDHPYLLTSCSRDNSIRLWNLSGLSNKLTEYLINFTNNSFDDEIFKNNSDLITRADLISNKFYYHDGLKDFWDLLRVANKNKEYSNENNRIFYITDLYSAYKSKAQKLEFSYFSKTKFNFSLRKEDLLREAIDVSAKAGDWEKFCELSVEANEWEKAIMAAPNVSISYWKELTKKYADHCNGKNIPSKKFASLLSNRLEPAIKIFMDSGDYEDAKLIWLTRGNKPRLPKESAYLEYENPELFNMNSEFLATIDEKLSNLTRDDILFQIVYSIAKDYQQRGFPILAAGSFLSIKDTYNAFKVLIRAAEYEIAYMLMKILNEGFYEEEIITGLCLKELKKRNVRNIISILQNTQSIPIKVTLACFIKNYTNSGTSIFEEFKLDEQSILSELAKSENSFLLSIVKKDINSAIKYFYDKTHDVAVELKSRIVKNYLIEEMIKLNFYFMAFNHNQLSNFNDKLIMRRLAFAAFLDTLNRNFKSCVFYLSEISRLLKKNYKLDEDELILVSFASSFVNSEKSKYEEYHVELHKSINDLQNSFKDYSNIQTDFEKEGTPESLKFHCADYGSFFFIGEELLPVNVNHQVVSTWNSKIIKGRSVNIRNAVNLSYSQALEWFKFIFISPFLDDFNLFNPH